MVKVKTDFKLNFNPNTVMRLINCSESSDLYEEMLEEFSVLAKESIDKIKPVALMEFGKIPKEISSDEVKEGTKALFCLISVGDELSKSSTKAFAEGDYVAGMMFDAMADDILFQMDDLLKEDIIAICKEKNYGIKARLEAPNDIEMRAQKTVWEITDALNIANIQIIESFMYDPVKTLANIYLLDESCNDFNVKHNCESCSSHDCPFREVSPKKITVLIGETSKVIFIKENQSILEALTANDIYLPAICGGRGTCGKCGITVLKGDVPPSKEDKKNFSEDQIKSGMRFSCRAYPKTDCVITLKQSEENFEVLTNYTKTEQDASEVAETNNSQKIVVDIGTTTIAMQRIDCVTGEVFDTYTTINKQRAYGADVISRIQASNEGKSEELKRIIISELSTGLNKIVDKSNKKVTEMIIAGNTTMVHLLMGYSCKTLGEVPFKAYNLDTIDTTFEGLPLTILPGISTFVGADITAGILACNLDIDTKISMLIDLGTNGEMAIGNKDKIFVTSTAAGPAFEGGNISCGTGSIAGAICNVKMDNAKVSSIKTIGDKSPVGICGTGVIEIVSELLKQELIDETGLLDEEYFEDGFLIATSQDGEDLHFTQKDIREVQLAKSAVRAGMETLMLRYGVSYDDVETVYLAGGFGYKMDIEKAIEIGMFPEEFKVKIIAVGNSSLNGCVKYATEDNQRERTEKICKFAKEIDLSSDKEFNNLYTEHMFFE